jgi:uncharacterized membrane protein
MPLTSRRAGHEAPSNRKYYLRMSDQRFWELDFLRGLAVLSMAGLHLVIDWHFLFEAGAVMPGPLYLWQRATAGLFLLLVGVSLSLSRAKAVKNAGDRRRLFLKLLRRGFAIFGWGMLITVATKLALNQGYVGFGVLHLIGSAVALSFPLLGLGGWNLGLGLGLIGIGVWLRTLRFSFPWLFWLGFIPEGFTAADYFPLLPWFGVVLIGVFLGDLLYPGHARRIRLSDRSGSPLIRACAAIGRHSLGIYLIHQPLFIGLLLLAGWLLRQ